MTADTATRTSVDIAETAEVERLVKENFEFVQGLADRWGRKFPMLRDDFESDGMLTLWQSAQTRATFRGTFKQLVRLQFTRRALALIQREKKRPDGIFNRDNSEDAPTVDDALDGGPGVELAVEVNDLLEQLPAKVRERVIRHVLDGETLKELGRERGVSRKAESQQQRHHLDKIATAETQA